MGRSLRSAPCLALVLVACAAGAVRPQWEIRQTGRDALRPPTEEVDREFAGRWRREALLAGRDLPLKAALDWIRKGGRLP